MHLSAIALGLALAAYWVFAFFAAVTLFAFGLMLCLTVIGMPVGLALIATGTRLLFVRF